jgi:hypothetical protein
MAEQQRPLEKLGGNLLTVAPRRRRVVWLIKGQAKTGKSHLAFDAPGPMGYINIDRGEEGTVEKFLEAGVDGKRKEIWNFDVNLTRDMIANQDADIVKVKCEPLLQRAMKFYDECLLGEAGKAHGVRSIIIDTWSEFFSLGCFARIGKDKQFMPELRTKINGIFSSMIHDALYADKNVLLLAKVTEWDGKVKAVGYNQSEGLVQTVIETGKKVTVKGKTRETAFTYTITDCRQNRELEGETFDSDELGEHPFARLASMIVPGSKMSDWR